MDQVQVMNIVTNYLSFQEIDGVFSNLCFFSDDVKNKLTLNNKKSYIA